MKIAILAAGAGGMYCGSCMRDNTLAAALRRAGHEAWLIPLYTPIRTDLPDVSINEVFYGGVNVYLQYASRLFQHTPRFFDWLFDRGWLLKLAGNAGAQTSPAKLGPFMLSILQGEYGPQIKELRRLIQYLKDEVRPDVVSLPNAMFVGLARLIRDELPCPIICELTGEDIFLDAMVEPYKTQARDAIRARCDDIARFVSTSAYYADRMAEYLNVPRETIDVVYPGVGREILDAKRVEPNHDGAPTIGFLARICPEKGIDRLVEAFALLRRMPDCGNVRLEYAGYLGGAHKKYFAHVQSRIDALGLHDSVTYRGEVDLTGKLSLLDRSSVFCVPAPYAEAKGIYVLEALARKTPVVMPAHGSFVELIEQSGGGVLVRPENHVVVAEALAQLLRDPEQRKSLGEAGRRAVEERFTDVTMAANMLKVYQGAMCPTQSTAARGTVIS